MRLKYENIQIILTQCFALSPASMIYVIRSYSSVILRLSLSPGVRLSLQLYPGASGSAWSIYGPYFGPERLSPLPAILVGLKSLQDRFWLDVHGFPLWLLVAGYPSIPSTWSNFNVVIQLSNFIQLLSNFERSLCYAIIQLKQPTFRFSRGITFLICYSEPFQSIPVPC